MRYNCLIRIGFAGEKSMATANIEQRVAALKAEVAELKSRLTDTPNGKTGWWNEIAGAFADDPAFDEAMRLGREYRESLRPKSRKPSRKTFA
jgi:hypothetical protein